MYVHCMLSLLTRCLPCVCSAIKPILHGENLLRANNIHLLRGFIQLGKLLLKHSDVKDCMSATDVFHTYVDL